MTQFISVVVLIMWTGFVSAVPITYTNTQFLTDALATAGANTTSDSHASPPNPLPLSTTAAATSDSLQDTARSTSTANSNELFASLDLDSFTENVNGVSTAEFVGDFVAPGGKVAITFALLNANSNGLGAALDTSVALQVFSNGETILNEIFGADIGSTTLTFDLPQGALARLDLLLLVTGDTTGGKASVASTLNFLAAPVQIPEAPTLTFMLAGLVLLSASRRKVGL